MPKAEIEHGFDKVVERIKRRESGIQGLGNSDRHARCQEAELAYF
jgi:hypothetical protein